MAKCSRCGTSLGFLSSATMCVECSAAYCAEVQARDGKRVENERRAREEQLRVREEVSLARTKAIRDRIEKGERVILYESIYLPVNSQIVDQVMANDFSIGSLRRPGSAGWDVVAVIPRTMGIALTNTSIGSSTGQTWGAGVGGNVVGVHVILKKEVSAQDNVTDKFLLDYVTRNLDDFLEEGG